MLLFPHGGRLPKPLPALQEPRERPGPTLPESGTHGGPHQPGSRVKRGAALAPGACSERRIPAPERPPTSATSLGPRRYVLRFRGFPPAWADATSSRYRVQSPTDTTASSSSSRKRLLSSLIGRRSSISSAARGLPMALRPAGRPSTGYPVPAALTRLRRSARRARSLPRSLSGQPAAHAPRAGVPRLRGRLAGLSPAAEPGSSSPSVHSTPLLVAGPPLPSLPPRSLLHPA
ncbi:hypothetical protein LTLLF_144825 [Microtus ochrogaster]|uniref:Uncharacterized protein n=1 Tax=Microtus ochrogaster TaxID=79684 RepID=A0A8J6KXF1_MICOH|nr:hypothetical protein LTLLF_144825 [Microtus ochrogaster]